jgi:hypothetical protein
MVVLFYSRLQNKHRGTLISFSVSLYFESCSYVVVYTHSVVPADFSGAVFTCAFFQKMLFLLYKLRNAFLVTNDLSGADLVHADFCQT